MSWCQIEGQLKAIFNIVKDDFMIWLLKFNYDFIIGIIIEFILATENVISEDILVKWSSKGPRFELPKQNF